MHMSIRAYWPAEFFETAPYNPTGGVAMKTIVVAALIGMLPVGIGISQSQVLSPMNEIEQTDISRLSRVSCESRCSNQIDQTNGTDQTDNLFPPVPLFALVAQFSPDRPDRRDRPDRPNRPDRPDRRVKGGTMKPALIFGSLFLVVAQVGAEDLGNLSANPYLYESTANPFGKGSSKDCLSGLSGLSSLSSAFWEPRNQIDEIDQTSLIDPLGAGSPFRSDSPNNPYGHGWRIEGR